MVFIFGKLPIVICAIVAVFSIWSEKYNVFIASGMFYIAYFCAFCAVTWSNLYYLIVGAPFLIIGILALIFKNRFNN